MGDLAFGIMNMEKEIVEQAIFNSHEVHEHGVIAVTRYSRERGGTFTVLQAHQLLHVLENHSYLTISIKRK